jgi:alanine racemase
MHRVGADLTSALGLARRIGDAGGLFLEGLWTHLAVADEADDAFTGVQLDRFASVRAELAAAGISPATLHVANSSGAIAHPASRFDLVRTGIALYGYLPSPAVRARWIAQVGNEQLRPVLSLKARVHYVRRLRRGARPSYGRREALSHDSMVATIPLGYADGVPRALGPAGGAVLIGGRRRPILGTVTMDQLMVDVGEAGDVAPGDEVVLLGRQGEEVITAEEWAELVGTISYEILCAIGPRVPRVAV